MAKQEEMKRQNEKLRQEIYEMKDDKLVKDRLPVDSNKKSPQTRQQQTKQKGQYKNEQS